MSTVMIFNLQKYCQTILQGCSLSWSFLDWMQTRMGVHLPGDGTVGRKDAKQALNQYILWKQKNDK